MYLAYEEAVASSGASVRTAYALYLVAIDSCPKNWEYWVSAYVAVFTAMFVRVGEYGLLADALADVPWVLSYPADAERSVLCSLAGACSVTRSSTSAENVETAGGLSRLWTSF